MLGGLLDHAGAHQVHLDIAQAGKKVVILMNQTVAETSFPLTARCAG